MLTCNVPRSSASSIITRSVAAVFLTSKYLVIHLCIITAAVLYRIVKSRQCLESDRWQDVVTESRSSIGCLLLTRLYVDGALGLLVRRRNGKKGTAAVCFSR